MQSVDYLSVKIIFLKFCHLGQTILISIKYTWKFYSFFYARSYYYEETNKRYNEQRIA